MVRGLTPRYNVNVNDDGDDNFESVTSMSHLTQPLKRKGTGTC